MSESSQPPLVGPVVVPGDKSLSHRALLLAALAPGASSLRGLNPGADVAATTAAIAALGCEVDVGDAEVTVDSPGLGRLSEPGEVIDCGNSGSTMRMLAGICAGIEGLSVLTGDASLRSRPMTRVVEPLRTMGATLDGRAGGSLPPVAIRGGHLTSIHYEMRVPSAQVKTALLLAGLAAGGVTRIIEPIPSRDHTERMLRAQGAAVATRGAEITLEGGSTVAPLLYDVPGDPSAAAFFAVGAILVPGSHIDIPEVAVNETRLGWVRALRAMGAQVEAVADHERCGEPVGTITATASELHGITLAERDLPAVIDEVPIVAVAATQAVGRTSITGAAELRVKESDRIAVLERGLKALGAKVEAFSDGLVIEGPTPLTGGVVDARSDHRMAMAFRIASLVASGPVKVEGSESVGTSFPGFAATLAGARATA